MSNRSESSHHPRRRIALIGLVTVAAIVLIGAAALIVANAVGGSPDLVAFSEDSQVVGGAVHVVGVVDNTGEGDAENLKVNVTLSGALVLKGTTTIPKLAHGASSPFEVVLDLGNKPLPINFTVAATPRWDVPKFDLQNEAGTFEYRGHVYGTRSGSLHNAGPGDASDVVMTIVISGDEHGNNHLATETAKLGTIAAGAAVPFSITADLGSDPPRPVYWDWVAKWAEPKVFTKNIQSTRVGGTITLTGSVTNRGRAAANEVVVTRRVLDATGRTIGVVSSKLGRLRPGAKADYTLTLPLGQQSVTYVRPSLTSLNWKEVHFFLFTTVSNRPA